MANRTKPDGFKMSNPALLLLIALLACGILLDGTLYNKPVVQQAIYPIADAQSIKLHHNGQWILGFSKTDEHWTQTHPHPAPALQARVQALLDTNLFSRRQYNESQVSGAGIFSDSVTLSIDDSKYEFGTIEPVSNLRYVRAQGRIYLQPDSVMPLLGAANNAFVDLGITGEVQDVSIGDSRLDQPSSWSNLQAIDIVEAPLGDRVEVSLTQNNEAVNLIATLSDVGYVLSDASGYHYLLDTATAASTGLAEHLN